MRGVLEIVMKKRITRHCGSKTSFHKMAQERFNSFVKPNKATDEMFTTINDQDKDSVHDSVRLTYKLYFFSQ